MADELRRLTVPHQKPGECKWCDARYERIVAASHHCTYGCNCGVHQCHCGCGECPMDCQCPGNLEPGKLCECENV